METDGFSSQLLIDKSLGRIHYQIHHSDLGVLAAQRVPVTTAMTTVARRITSNVWGVPGKVPTWRHKERCQGP